MLEHPLLCLLASRILHTIQGFLYEPLAEGSTSSTDDDNAHQKYRTMRVSALGGFCMIGDWEWMDLERYWLLPLKSQSKLRIWKVSAAEG